MSRDVAYRNGYLPLYAGAELIRRSGSLTQFPADNLIGTLPTPVGCAGIMQFSGSRPPAPPESIALSNVFLYSNIEQVYREYLQEHPGDCNLLVDALEQSIAVSGGFLPVVQEGSPVPDLGDPTNWSIIPDTPGVLGGIGFGVAYSDGTTTSNGGSLVVSISAAGVVSVDTSNLLPMPTTFQAGVLEQVACTLLLTFQATGTWWPQFNAHTNARTWVECLNGGPCA